MISGNIPANVGRVLSRRAVTEDTDVVASDDYVVATDDAVLTLPAANSVPAGWVVILANADPANNTVTVEPAGEDTIGNVAGALTLSASANMVELVSDGDENWESIRAGTP